MSEKDRNILAGMIMKYGFSGILTMMIDYARNRQKGDTIWCRYAAALGHARNNVRKVRLERDREIAKKVKADIERIYGSKTPFCDECGASVGYGHSTYCSHY